MTQDEQGSDTISVIGWEEFQHYKDRDPLWIKLHRSLLDNYEWGQLCDITKAHLVGIWLLAARFDNKVPADPVWIGRRIGAHEPVDLQELIDAGFITTEDLSGDALRKEWATRHIPEEVKKLVYKRDGGRCQGYGRKREGGYAEYYAEGYAEGQKTYGKGYADCGATTRLEYNHIIPVSRGGTSSPDNLQLLCTSCNRRRRAELTAAERAEDGATSANTTTPSAAPSRYAQSATQGANQEGPLRSLEERRERGEKEERREREEKERDIVATATPSKIKKGRKREGAQTPEERDFLEWVWNCWLNTMGYQERKLSLGTARTKIALARYREGRNREEFEAIIRWASTDPWMRGTDPNSTKAYDDFDTLFRPSNFDKYVKRAGDARKGDPRKDPNLAPSDRPMTFERM